MTVAELIEELKKLPQDAEVAVKHRDEGGLYDGCDTDIKPIINKNDKTCDEGIVLL